MYRFFISISDYGKLKFINQQEDPSHKKPLNVEIFHLIEKKGHSSENAR